MNKIVITSLICLAFIANVISAKENKSAIQSSIPYLEQRLESSIWQVRYSLLGELNGHDILTKQLLETLIKDEHSMVRNQAIVHYLNQFVYINKELFEPFTSLRLSSMYLSDRLPKANDEWLEVCLSRIDTSTSSNFIIPAEPNDIINKLDNPNFSEASITTIGILGDNDDAKALYPYLESTNDFLALCAAKSVIRLGETGKRKPLLYNKISLRTKGSAKQ